MEHPFLSTSSKLFSFCNDFLRQVFFPQQQSIADQANSFSRQREATNDARRTRPSKMFFLNTTCISMDVFSVD